MNKLSTNTGKIITFYSFKGGVGRSMAMANVGVLLAEWGYKTLMIDWDLEAPGLENFFNVYADNKTVKAKPGLIDLLTQSIRSKSSKETPSGLRWKDCIVPITISGADKSFQVDLITAGTIDDGYYEKVRSFDFTRFYEQHDGGEVIERMRTEWLLEYDFVLIDSRTGVTDVGGVCTIHLPDILVVLFTPTNQSLEGVKRIALKAMTAQRKLPYDRINLLTLPVPTRIDNTEFKLSKQWFVKFEDELREIYSSWMPHSENGLLNKFLLNSKVPYISYFSFGEKLPVLEEGVADPTSIGYSYQSIASLLATRLDYPDLLINNRKKLIDFARFPEEKETIERYGPSRKPLSLSIINSIRKLKRLANTPMSISYTIIVVAFSIYQMVSSNETTLSLRRDIAVQQARYDSLNQQRSIVNDSLNSTEQFNLRRTYRLKNTLLQLDYASQKEQAKNPKIRMLVEQMSNELDLLERKSTMLPISSD